MKNTQSTQANDIRKFVFTQVLAAILRELMPRLIDHLKDLI